MTSRRFCSSSSCKRLEYKAEGDATRSYQPHKLWNIPRTAFQPLAGILLSRPLFSRLHGLGTAKLGTYPTHSSQLNNPIHIFIRSQKTGPRGRCVCAEEDHKIQCKKRRCIRWSKLTGFGIPMPRKTLLVSHHSHSHNSNPSPNVQRAFENFQKSFPLACCRSPPARSLHHTEGGSGSSNLPLVVVACMLVDRTTPKRAGKGGRAGREGNISSCHAITTTAAPHTHKRKCSWKTGLLLSGTVLVFCLHFRPVSGTTDTFVWRDREADY